MKDLEADQEEDDHNQAQDLNRPLLRLWLRERLLNWQMLSMGGPSSQPSYLIMTIPVVYDHGEEGDDGAETVDNDHG